MESQWIGKCHATETQRIGGGIMARSLSASSRSKSGGRKRGEGACSKQQRFFTLLVVEKMTECTPVSRGCQALFKYVLSIAPIGRQPTIGQQIISDFVRCLVSICGSFYCFSWAVPVEDGCPYRLQKCAARSSAPSQNTSNNDSCRASRRRREG